MESIPPNPIDPSNSIRLETSFMTGTIVRMMGGDAVEKSKFGHCSEIEFRTKTKTPGEALPDLVLQNCVEGAWQ